MDEDNRKYIAVLQALSLRNLVEKANEIGIQKEDFLYITKEHDTFFLLYYK